MGKISLRAARVNAGYTLEEVSKKTGISKYTLGNYEKGTSQPRWDKFLSLCELYEQSVNDVYVPKE